MRGNPPGPERPRKSWRGGLCDGWMVCLELQPGIHLIDVRPPGIYPYVGKMDDKGFEERKMPGRSRVTSGSPNHQPVDILLVEDNAADARLAAEALKESGFSNRLHWVADGVQAMEFLRREGRRSDVTRPGLILLDLNLPKKDGREVLAELKRDPSLKRIPVVVLTTSRAREDRDRSYDLNANCFITKPGEWNEYVKVVRSIKDFWFGPVTLPVAGAAGTEAAIFPHSPPVPAFPAAAEGRTPLRILLVDDSAGDVRMVRELLAEAGQSHIDLRTAGSVGQALDLVGEEMFDAVLLDLSLPEDRLSRALEHARRNRQGLAVLFLDLDHFKTINDTSGHAVGDQLLQAVAARLCGCVRASDTVARVGGDEFTIVLAEIARLEDITTVAGKIVESFRSPFPVDGRELTVTASIGACLYPSDGEDADTLLKNADTAMYRAKEHRRNNLHLYAPISTTPVSERESLVAALRLALERHEFVLHYQPTVDALSGSIVGLEALVRWQHPMAGLLLPQRFLPIAEETGLIVDIGEWVLRRVCEQGCAWQQAGLQPLRVAVNASYRQLNLGRTWIETVARVLRETGLDPSRLELEVTEESIMKAESTAVKTLRALHEMGIRISVHDFGTGYASLSRLRCFPFASVKIDQTFIHDVTINPDDAAIVAAITAMGHTLRMSVLAEGVSTAEQVSFLLRHQIDLMQGPYFSRPLPEDATARLIRGRRLPPVRRRGSRA